MTVNVTKSSFNFREKLKELERPIGLKGNELMRAETAQDARDLVSAGRKNLIINGGFEISQRGDYSSNTATGQNAYRLDRWKHLVQVVTTNTRRDRNQTINGELMNIWRIEATSTGTGRFGIRQYLEANSNGRTPTAGKLTTLSVWMRSNNPNSGIYIYDYGTPGILQSFDWHSGSGEWEKLSITFIPSTGAVTANGYGLEINFVCSTSTNGNVSVTSGDYIEIAQPQLEVGKNATEFEHRSYGEELSLCQRYYQYIVSGWWATRSATGTVYSNAELDASTIILPTPMRAIPTVRGKDNGAATITSQGFSSAYVTLASNYELYVQRQFATNSGIMMCNLGYSQANNGGVNLATNVVMMRTAEHTEFDAEL